MAEVVGSPLWWLDRLYRALQDRAKTIDEYEKYYNGDQQLVFGTQKFQEAFGGLFGRFSDNWCGLVVDAVEERLNVQGFRIGDTPEGRADADAWEIFQRNNLDAGSQLGHTTALVKTEAYTLTWADADGHPSISVEDPSQVIVAYAPGSKTRRVAGLKVFFDDVSGHAHATVFLPDWIYKYRSRYPLPPEGMWVPGEEDWVEDEQSSEAWPLRNPLGVVPLVPLVNRPRLLGPPQSEIALVIPVQNAVNKLGLDLLVASEFAAFRQRWVVGMDIEYNDDGTPKPPPFKAGVDRIWQAESPDTEFGEFSESNLENYVRAIQMLIQHIASQTRTPPHYFYLSGQFPSGESIKSAETGLVAKTRRKMTHFGEAWEETIRLAFAVLGDPRAKVLDGETIWGDPESRSESELADALMKRHALGVPLEQLWEDLGYSPQQIARFKAMRAADDLMASVLTPEVPVA